MTTTIEPKARQSTIHSKETLLFEANTSDSTIHTPKRLKWSEITRSGNWEFEEIVAPRETEDRSKASRIITRPDGSVIIDFNREEIPPSISSRFSDAKTFDALSFKSQSTQETPVNLKLKGVDFKENLPFPIYTKEDEKSSDHSNFTYNPTGSQIGLLKD